MLCVVGLALPVSDCLSACLPVVFLWLPESVQFVFLFSLFILLFMHLFVSFCMHIECVLTGAHTAVYPYMNSVCLCCPAVTVSRKSHLRCTLATLLLVAAVDPEPPSEGRAGKLSLQCVAWSYPGQIEGVYWLFISSCAEHWFAGTEMLFRGH